MSRLEPPISLATLAQKIEYLEEENHRQQQDIEKLEAWRIKVDLLWAKAGGMWMLLGMMAMGAGTLAVTFSDKLKAFFGVVKP